MLVTAVALTRFAFRSHELYDVDSVHFALAMGRFDPVTYQPHPPGYFLYICLGRLVNLLFQNANTALVVISIAASCATVVMIYLLAREWFGERAALFSGVLFVVSPLAWFHGVVALTYIVETCFSAAAGCVCWRVCRGETRWLFIAALVLGVGAGIRPSSLLLLGPLLLFAWWHAPRRQVLASAALLGIVLLAWFLPMMEESGGEHAYFSALGSLWKVAGGSQTVFNSSPFMSIARFLTVLFIFGLCFGCAVLFGGEASRVARKTPGRIKVFTAVWATPALLFFTFIFLRFVNSGYLLIALPPVCIWLGAGASEWYAKSRIQRPWKAALIGAGAAVNVTIFLAAPLYCSYREIRHFEKELADVRDAVRQIASPDTTLIVGFDSHFLGFRHAGYYLPQYTTVEYPETRFPQGLRVFAMQGRDTRLTGRVRETGFSNFLLFPLPLNDQSYREYARKVQDKLPASDLHIVRAGHHEFVMGPISDLPYLFPKTAQSPDVYTAHHFSPRGVYNR